MGDRPGCFAFYSFIWIIILQSREVAVGAAGESQDF